LYDRFNARDLDAALTTMNPDVVWANGLEGGFVYGHDGVRGYWIRQWATMESRAEPISFSSIGESQFCVEVHLTARNRDGILLFDTHGRHMFEIRDGLISRFDVR
jgi:hypothetical protein